MENVKHIVIKQSQIGQFEDRLGVFANKDFQQNEVVLKWELKVLSRDEYEALDEYERDNFCHIRKGVIYLYPDPERHVNRSNSPNVAADFERQANIALREIKKGEELSIAESTVEDF